MRHAVLGTALRTSGLTLLLTAAALTSSAAPAAAQSFGRNQVKYEDFDFKVLTLPHWDLYFYSQEEEAIKDVSRMSERWYERFARAFQHEFEKSKPLIIYADHPDFEQTNTLAASELDQGIGGVTEPVKNRVIMPLTGSYADNDHVLGHELVHAFQFNIAQSRRGGGYQGLGNLPGWLIEGMAEYFSLGRQNSLTGMWLRGALQEGDFPTIQDLNRGDKYFPYRFGQGLWAYVGGTYGDDAVVQLFRRSLRIGFGPAIEQVLGVDQDTLSAQWRRSVERAYQPLMIDRTKADSTGTVILSPKTEGGKLNIAPSLSPDGKYIAYISEKDVFSIELFLADAKTGKTIRKLSDATANPHFDALSYIESAGTWSPDGKLFAYAVFAGGDNQLVIVNTADGSLYREVNPIKDGSLVNPAWSPDGRYIAFSGAVGGIGDLFLYDVQTGDVRQLTHDKNGDFHPDWSPDGKTIAFTSDRGPETDFDKLTYSEYHLSFYDMATGRVTTPDLLGNVRESNPQYAPDGSVYFLSDADGFSDIYVYQPSDQSVKKVTNIVTGVSSFTSMGPALSVADRTGELAFSVFYNLQEFYIATLPANPPATLVGRPTAEQMSARNLPPLNPDRFSVVKDYLADASTGLEPAGTFDTGKAADYKPQLALDYLGQPSLGVGSNRFGNYVGGGASATFSDMLGNHNLSAAVQAQGTVKDMGGAVYYADLGDRWNWVAGLSHIPYVVSYISQGVDEQGPYLGQILDRVYQSTALGAMIYPFSSTRRLEFSGSFTRYASNQQIQKFYVDPFGRCCIDQQQEDLPERFRPLDLVTASAGIVHDNSFIGFTSPVRGGRSRYEVSATTGTLNYLTVNADWRRYLGLNRNLTFAMRAMHFGQYGNLVAHDQQVLNPVFLGYEYYLRGYDYSSFTPEECNRSLSDDDVAAGSCPVRNRLFGHKIGIASAEFRVPLLGVEQYGLINFPFVPTELELFADGGIAWDSHLIDGNGQLEMSDDPVFKWSRTSMERIPVFSTGIGARFNLLRFLVLEAFYVKPWQRPAKGPHWGFTIQPGW